ncbi:Rossmann-like domain-containing protein [Limisalsivibrio acetivorans]|uniref:Rossmann-like domain-containing protein n=1 Tax=Limisalsivibrio acetivorans TaxID=1304888 RepID=UPI0003B74AA5|nr:DUF364 domain-containing protein [Limisalsivibrio acetivorans]
MNYEGILNEVLPKLEGLSVLDYVVGLNYVCVRTEAGCGLGYVLRDFEPESCTLLSDEIEGMPAADAARIYMSENLLDAAVGMAVINSTVSGGRDIDPLKDTDFSGKTVGMVGHLRPVQAMIERQGGRVHVFELKDREGTLNPEDAPDYMPDCDTFIITGVTLINKTLHTYEPYMNDNAQKIIIGPSTPVVQVLADRGYLLGGTKVVDCERVMKLVSRGQGTRRFGDSVAKVWL